jgi:DNA-binding NarL/FixJ family response regulator
MSDQTLRILLVEDSAGDARLLRVLLDEPGSCAYHLTWHDSLDTAIRHLQSLPVDVALLDLGLAGAEGLTVVRRARDAAPRVPLIALAGHDDEALAAGALKDGAQGYLVKGQIDARGLVRAMLDAIERMSLDGRIAYINPAAEKMNRWLQGEAIGRTAHARGVTLRGRVR